MLFSKLKDIKIRKSFHKIEKLKKVRKFLFINLLNSNLISYQKKSVILFLLKKKFKNLSKSKVKIVRRCVINNRSRGVLRSFNISRIFLRELMQFGIIPGYSKAVW